MGDRQWFVLYVLVCLEVGIFLTLVPWSAIWERNYFLQAYPSLRPLILSPTLRGAVCGLGLANIYVGVSEIIGRLRESASRRDETETVDQEHYEEEMHEQRSAMREQRSAISDR